MTRLQGNYNARNDNMRTTTQETTREQQQHEHETTMWVCETAQSDCTTQDSTTQHNTRQHNARRHNTRHDNTRHDRQSSFYYAAALTTLISSALSFPASSRIWKNLSVKFEDIWSYMIIFFQIWLICWFAKLEDISKVPFKISSYMENFLNFCHNLLTFSQSFSNLFKFPNFDIVHLLSFSSILHSYQIKQL